MKILIRMPFHSVNRNRAIIRPRRLSKLLYSEGPTINFKQLKKNPQTTKVGSNLYPKANHRFTFDKCPLWSISNLTRTFIQILTKFWPREGSPTGLIPVVGPILKEWWPRHSRSRARAKDIPPLAEEHKIMVKPNLPLSKIRTELHKFKNKDKGLT